MIATENCLAFSQPPEIPVDDPVDVLREIGAELNCPPEFKGFLDRFIEAAKNEFSGLPEAEKNFAEEISKTLDVIMMLPDTRIAAFCLQSILRKNGKSERQVADELGVTKACICKYMSIIRDHFGIAPRGGRSEKSRVKFAHKRIDQSRKPRVQQDWAGAHVWRSAPQLAIQ